MENDEELITEIEQEIPHLHRYARSLERKGDRADDLLQDTLERAITKQEQFRKGTNLRRWLFAIMRNAFIDKRRKKARRGPHVPVEEWYHETHAPGAQMHHMYLRDVRRAMEGLRGCDREIVRRVVFDGQRYKDVAGEMGVAVGTVKSRLSRARQILAAEERKMA